MCCRRGCRAAGHQGVPSVSILFALQLKRLVRLKLVTPIVNQPADALWQNLEGRDRTAQPSASP
jgi:hypothetical protein